MALCVVTTLVAYLTRDDNPAGDPDSGRNSRLRPLRARCQARISEGHVPSGLWNMKVVFVNPLLTRGTNSSGGHGGDREGG